MLVPQAVGFTCPATTLPSYLFIENPYHGVEVDSGLASIMGCSSPLTFFPLKQLKCTRPFESAGSTPGDLTNRRQEE